METITLTLDYDDIELIKKLIKEDKDETGILQHILNEIGLDK